MNNSGGFENVINYHAELNFYIEFVIIPKIATGQMVSPVAHATDPVGGFVDLYKKSLVKIESYTNDVENKMQSDDTIQNAAFRLKNLKALGFPLESALKLFEAFITDNTGDIEGVLQIIKDYRKLLENCNIPYSESIKEILKIFYYIWFYKKQNPGERGKSEEEDLKHANTFKKLARRLLFLIMLQTDGRLKEPVVKFLIFHLILFHVKKEKRKGSLHFAYIWKDVGIWWSKIKIDRK